MRIVYSDNSSVYVPMLNDFTEEIVNGGKLNFFDREVKLTEELWYGFNFICKQVHIHNILDPDAMSFLQQLKIQIFQGYYNSTFLRDSQVGKLGLSTTGTLNMYGTWYEVD